MQYCTTSLDGREDEYSLRDSLECAHATFSFGYEGLLQHGVDQGWYDPKVPLEA